MKLPPVSVHSSVIHKGFLSNHIIYPLGILSSYNLRALIQGYHRFSNHQDFRYISERHFCKDAPQVFAMLVGDGTELPENHNNRKIYDDDKLDPVANKSKNSLISEINSSSISRISGAHGNCSQRQHPLFDHSRTLDKLKAVKMHVLASEELHASSLKLCHRNYLPSATNLIHYLAIQSLVDVHQLSAELSSIGLLNLETTNSCILSGITAATQLLQKQAPISYSTCQLDKESMRTRASKNATQLLGPVLGLDKKRSVRHIMVNVDSKAATDEMLITHLLKAGANIIRINCAHDDASAWSEIIRRVKHTSMMLDKPCKILMDLAGPKLRTGLILPNSKEFIKLRKRDSLTICRNNHHIIKTSTQKTLTCDSSYLFDSVRPGDRIAFHDGRIWGVIQTTSHSEFTVSVTHADRHGSKLGCGRSINIPDTEIKIEGLTSKDIQDLDFVSANADMVGVSFAKDARDVEVVLDELAKRKMLSNLGVVLKVETRGGFEKLPMLLLKAMEYKNPFGVMIARGDLAVECGWEKMGVIQETILEVCSAAHVPVIWATQVLDSVVKNGIPTRAEITDVACGMRANCIMLNKGKHIVEAVSCLESILNYSSNKKNIMKSL